MAAVESRRATSSFRKRARVELYRFPPASPYRRVAADLALRPGFAWAGWAARGQRTGTTTGGAARRTRRAAPNTPSTSSPAGTTAETGVIEDESDRVEDRRRRVKLQASRAARAARTARIRQAFVASSELRPMAQQLATLRTPEAYAGVTAYAHRHTRRGGRRGLSGAGPRVSAGQALCGGGSELCKLVRRQAGEIWPTIADFLAAEADHDAGDEGRGGGAAAWVCERATQTASSTSRRRSWRRTFCWR